MCLLLTDYNLFFNNYLVQKYFVKVIFVISITNIQVFDMSIFKHIILTFSNHYLSISYLLFQLVQ